LINSKYWRTRKNLISAIVTKRNDWSVLFLV
jgi:hypothetical protein